MSFAPVAVTKYSDKWDLRKSLFCFAIPGYSVFTENPRQEPEAASHIRSQEQREMST